MAITDNKLPIYIGLFRRMHKYTSQKSWERVRELKRTISKASSYFFVDTPWWLTLCLLYPTRFRNNDTSIEIRFIYDAETRFNHEFEFDQCRYMKINTVIYKIASKKAV